MNWLDIFLIFLAGLMVFEGVREGFTRQAIGLAATLVGLVVASWTYGTAGSILAEYLSSRALANIIGFLMVFVGIQLLGALLSWALGKLFKWTGLTWLDRLFGAAFGIVKAAIIGVVFVMILTAFPLKPVPESIRNSKAAPYLIEASHVLVQLAPRELKDGFVSTYDRIKRIWSGEPEKSSPDSPSKPPRDSA